MPLHLLEARTPRSTRTFFIARHGETTWNAIDRLQGTLDESVLTPAGEAQAAALGERLCAEEGGAIGSVLCSSLGRARQTHAIVRARFAGRGAGLPAATFTPELREIELRQWEGRIKHELAFGAEAAAWHKWKQRPSEFAFGDGFSPLRELMRRAERCWRELLLGERSERGGGEQERAATLVIGHSGLNRALLVAALGLPIESFSERRFGFANCAWLEVEVGPGPPPDAVRWRWRHPVAGAWRTARQEREHALRETLRGARSSSEETSF